MRPRYIVNIGIAKIIKAVGKIFTVGSKYEARIYYSPKDSLAINAVAYCAETEEGKHEISFYFSPEKTALLKRGVVSLDIFDENYNRLVFRDNFAIVRPNSVSLTPTEPVDPEDPDEPEIPVTTLTGSLPASELDFVTLTGSTGLNINTEGYRFLLRTNRPASIKFVITTNNSSSEIWQPLCEISSPTDIYDAHNIYHLSSNVFKAIKVGDELRIGSQEVTVVAKYNGPERVAVEETLDAYSSAGTYQVYQHITRMKYERIWDTLVPNTEKTLSDAIGDFEWYGDFVSLDVVAQATTSSSANTDIIIEVYNPVSDESASES